MSALRQVVDDALAAAATRRLRAVDFIDHVVAALVEASGGPEHIVSIDGSRYTIQHPIAERFEGDLFDCRMTADVGMFMAGEEDGRYRVWRTEEGGDVLAWEVLDEPEA